MDHIFGITPGQCCPSFSLSLITLCSDCFMLWWELRLSKATEAWNPYTVDAAASHLGILHWEVYASPSFPLLWRIVDELDPSPLGGVPSPRQPPVHDWHSGAKYQAPCLKIEPITWGNSSSRAAHGITLKMVSSWDPILALLSSSGLSWFTLLFLRGFSHQNHLPRNPRHTFCFWGTHVKTRRTWDIAGREWILGRVWRGDAGETMKLVSGRW